MKLIIQSDGERFEIYIFLNLFFLLDTNTATGRKINNLAEEGLFYLDTRTDFWQQVRLWAIK